MNVLEALGARRHEGGRDGRRLAIVIEGGGSRATFSAGMAVALEDLGLTALLDDAYGVSAGSINAAWLVGGKAREAMDPWLTPSVMRRSINPRRALRGGRVVDLDYLVEHAYLHELPFPGEAILGSTVTFHPMATDADTGYSTDLAPLIDDEWALRRAIQASSTLPVIAGPPVQLGGRRWVDGGLAEPVAVHTALAQDITHLIVLRTHAATHPPAEPPSLVDAVVRRWLRRHAPGVLGPWAQRVGHAETTETLLGELEAEGRVLQVRPPDDAPTVSRVSTDTGLLAEALRIGQEAAEAILGGLPSVTRSPEA